VIHDTSDNEVVHVNTSVICVARYGSLTSGRLLIVTKSASVERFDRATHACSFLKSSERRAAVTR
jgi:hypothetical protein